MQEEGHTQPILARRPIVIGNWKMHGTMAENAVRLRELVSGVSHLDETEKVICPPFLYLAQVKAALAHSPIAWGAQTVAAEPMGAYTGDVSAAMLQDFSCRFALVGHSERRQYHHEAPIDVLKQVRRLHAVDISPIICVGETLLQYQAGHAESAVRDQLQLLGEALSSEAWSRSIIAYEPLWAIGTGQVATAMDAQRMHAFIRQVLFAAGAQADRVRIVYGGSVRAENAAQLAAMRDVDGVLVGAASLRATEFIRICQQFTVHGQSVPPKTAVFS